MNILDDSVAGQISSVAVLADLIEAHTEAQNFVTIRNLRASTDISNVPTDGLGYGLFFPTGTCSEELKLIQDGRIKMVPAANASYRFGGYDGQTDAATRPEYDGLEMYTGLKFDAQNVPLPNAQQDELNKLQLSVSTGEPTLHIKYSKNQPNTDVIQILNSNDDTALRFNAAGEYWQRCTDSQRSAFQIYGRRQVAAADSEVFTVKGSGQVDCGNAHIWGTIDGEDLLTVRKHNQNIKFKIQENGKTVINSTSGIPFQVNDSNAHQTLNSQENGKTVINSTSSTGQ